MQFQEEMEALLERHVLNGLVDAPWVRTDDPESDDDGVLCRSPRACCLRF